MDKSDVPCVIEIFSKNNDLLTVAVVPYGELDAALEALAPMCADKGLTLKPIVPHTLNSLKSWLRTPIYPASENITA